MEIYILIVLFFATAMVVTNSQNEIASRANETFLNEIKNRLPKDVIPSKYIIAISPDLVKDEFHGAIQIDFEVLDNRDHVILHGKNLTIASSKLYRYKLRDAKEKIPIKSICTVDKYEIIILNLYESIKGKYSLRMNFSGSLIDKINGFYLSTYQNQSNSSLRKMAVTQFEPVYARKTFPCFDEPNFKSIFHVRIVYDSKNGYHALSNMPAVKVEHPMNNSDLTITTFAASLPMSTYLLAFVVSDLICSTSSVKSLDGRTIPISIYSKSNDRNKIQLALTVSAKAMEFYGNLFGIDYPLPKIDLVAVPDFAAGAMENWGLITFRESQLFFAEKHSSCSNMKSVALTVSHELAHMWFGNLVTLKWWKDLWLNEGFATYMEHMAVDYIFPEWRQKDAFILDTKYVTMKHDSKVSSHPVVHRSENSDEIGEMFDHISYQKGAAIIRMLEDAMGDYKFISGIKNYLKTYMYGNAETCQLFQILQKYFRPDIDIVKFMRSWTNYPGFPVISVQCHGDSLRLTQKRYIYGSSENIDSNQSWDIPIKYITSREDGVQFGWFLGNSSCVELALEAPVDWIKLNHQSVGYYIVNYTLDAWKMFSHLLIEDFQILDPLDRADLLHDAFLLADSNDLSYCALLNLTTYLTNENALQPWTVAANWLRRTEKLLSGTKLYLHFQVISIRIPAGDNDSCKFFMRQFREQFYAQTLLEAIYKKVGWKVEENESMTRRELRVVILKSACTVGHKDCLAVAKTRLKDFIASNGTTRPHPDLRSVVYSFGLISLGGEAQSIFERMWHLFLCENDVQEKEKLMIGLASVRDRNILNRFLINVTNENIVRRQNFFEIIVKIASNPMGLDIVWNFVRGEWQKLVNKYTLNDFSMGLAVGSIVSLFKDNQKLEEAKTFFAKHPNAGAGSNARRDALEEVANSIGWLTSNLPKIKKWMQTKEFTRDTEAENI